MADLLTSLADLDRDPDDTAALAALQAQAAALDAAAVEAVAGVRARLRDRGRPERALALLDLELGAVKDRAGRLARLLEKARILDEDLLDAAGATAAYKDVLALDKKHEDADDALAQLALGKKGDNWKKFAAKFVSEATAASDRTLATGLYLSAAEQWGRFAPGKADIEDLLRKSLEADPGNRKASRHLERALRASGRWPELAALYERRLETAATPVERTDAALALAELAHDHLGDDARALALGRQVLATDPAHPRALARVVHALEAQQDGPGLAAVYGNALKVKGDEPALLLAAGTATWKKVGDLDAAEDFFRRLRRIDPADPVALDFYRAYHGARNEPAKLVAVLRQAEKALPAAGTSPATDARARALAIEIAELSESGSPDKAIDAWKQMLRLEPTSTDAREALKRLYRKAERWNALLDLLKDEAERLPADDLAGKKERMFEMIAIYRDRLRQDPMVINTYNAVLKLDPDDARAADELADKYRAMSRWQDLINVLGRKAELTTVALPRRVALLREVADLWLERFNNHAQAVRPLERLLELAPADGDAINRLKDIYGKRRQWRPLIGLLGREADLLEGAARQAKLAEMARLAAERAGDPRLAIEIHNRVIAEHGGGGDDETLAALAALYERDKRWLALAEILDRQRKRAKRPQEQVQLLEKIGAILADRAHAPAAAAQVWNEILAVDPGHGKALRTLRELYAAAGDWDGLEGLYGRLGQWDELVDALFALGDRQDDRATRLALFRRAAAIAARKPEGDRVIRAWERVLAVEPTDADAARALIPAYTRAEKWAKLLPLREALLAQAPDDSARLTEMSEIRTLTEHKLGSKALALTWTARAFELAPDDAELVGELLRLAQQPEQWREVAAVLSRAADDPQRPLPTRMRLLRTLAELYGDQLDDDEAARNANRKLLGLTPDDPAAALAYEELSERLADWPELLASLRRRADAAGGDEQRALYGRIASIEEEKLADLDAAAVTVGRILALAPADPATLASLARLHEARGDWEALAAVLETQLATEPAAAGGRGLLHLRLGGIHAGIGDGGEHAARGLDHYLAALALAAEGAADAPPEHAAVAAATRYLEPTGPGRGLTDARRRDVAAAVEPYLRRAADAPMLARALEVLAGGAEPGSAQALGLDRRLVGLYHQLAQPEKAWEAAARVVAGDPADDEARAALTALAHDLGRAPELAQHLAGALAARRKAGATATEIRALASELAHLHADLLGDPAGAEQAWKVVLEVEPDDAEAFVALADLYRQGERWAELRQLLERRATAAVDVEERRSALIEIATLDEEVAADGNRAIETYRRLLDVDPAYLPAYKALDRLYAERQAWGELDAILERSFDSVPAGEQVTLLYRRAELHAHHLADPLGAVDLLEDVLTRAPGHADGRELLEELLAVPDLRQRVAAMLEPLYAKDRLWKDLTGVLRIQREAADSPLAAVELLARVAAVEEGELGNLRAAFDTWAQALAADPSDPRPSANLIRLAGASDRWGDAARALEDAATGAEPHVAIPLLRQLAEIADISLGDNQRAIAAYQRLYQAAPHDAEVAGPALVALAGLYTDEQNWPELDRVLHLHADGAPTADARARLLAQAAELEERELNDRDKAIATWNQILADDAEDEGALLALERLYQASDRWKDLAENLRRQADRAEAPAERIALLRRLAEIHEVMLEDGEQAIAAHLEILDHDGEDAAALDELARLYQEQQRPADRFDILERRLILADQRGEHDVVARRHELAQLLAGPLGREPEALERWAEVLERDPGHVEAAAAVQRALADPDLAGRATAILEPLYEATGRDVELTELLWQMAGKDASTRDKLHRQTRVAQIRERRLGDKAGAFAALEAAVRTAVAEPELPEVLAELDRLAADLGREGDLIAVYRDIADDVLDGELQRRLFLDIADLARAVHNDAALAARYYHKVLDSQPDDRRALGALESIYRQGGQGEELYKILQQKVELADTDPADRKNALAEMATLAGGPLRRTDDAITAWSSVLEIDPADVAAATALEALYRDQGRWHELIELYERRAGFAETLDEAVALRVKAGQVHEQELRDLTAAVESYGAALSGDPTEPTALAALERMLGELDVRAQAAEVLEPIYISRQDWPRLVRIYEVRLEAAGDPAERLELTRQIARLHEEQLEDLEQAFAWYGKVLREDPSDPDRGQLHRLAQILDLWPQLAAVYQGVLDDDSGDAPHLRAIAADAAVIYDRRLDRWEPGAAAYLRALAGFVPGDEGFPPLRDLFAGLEQLYLRHQQWRPLAAAYGEAHAAVDDEAWRRELQARQAVVLEQRLGDADGAIDAWRGVLASAADAGADGEYTRAAVELDRLYRLRGRWYDLAELLGERLTRTAGEADQLELRLALADVLERELHDGSAAVDQYQEVLASSQPERAAAALERLLADVDQRGRAAELLEPYYRRRDAWPRLVALLEHEVEHQDDPESKTVALLEVAELHDVRGGDQARALDALARAWLIDPARREVFDRLVQHGTRMAAWDELVAILEKGAAATLDPEASALALGRVAELHEGPRGDRPAAIAAWRKVLAAMPDDASALASLDRLLAVEGRPGELVTVVERRAELTEDGGQRLVLLHRVASLYEEVLNQPREAVAAYKNVLAADDTDGAALDALERLYRQLALPRELVPILERKLELADDVGARRQLRLDLARVSERELGDAYEAQNQLQAVLAEDPTDDEALAELDRLYGASRMWTELLDVLERRSTLADDTALHAELRFRAGRLSEQELSDPDGAIEKYGEVLTLVPGHAGARAALEGLLAQDAYLGPAAELLERHHRTQGDHDALVRVLERRLEGTHDPEERRNLWASLADVHETLRNDLAAASQTWARALVENPADRALIGPIERLAATRGSWAEVAALLEGRLAAGVEPELEHDYAMRLGKIYEEHLGSAAQAATAYERAAATMMDEPAALAALNRVLWRLERWPELARVLERQAELADDAHVADLTFRLGDVRETQLHDLHGAIAAYRAVVERERGHKAARASLERLLGQAEGDRATIIETLEPLYEDDGDWPRLLDVLTAKLGVTEDRHERAALYHRIATLAEGKTGDVGRALDAAAGWLGEDPSSTDALAELNRLAGRDARWFDVATWVEQIAARAGDAALPLWMYAGTVQLDRLGDPARATEAFHQALTLDGDHQPALEALERTYRSTGELGPLAGVLARQAELAFDPSAKIELWREVAELREQSQDDDGAIAAWEHVVDLADDDRDPLAHLARLHERRGDQRALVGALERAARIAADAHEEKAIRVRIARIHGELGDHGAAAGAWQSVLDLDPADAGALDALEGVHVAAKDWMAVQDLLARRLDLARTHSEKAAVLTRMAELAEKERGAPDDAIAHWYAVLDQDNAILSAYDELERLLARQGRWHDLVELLDRRADVHGTMGDDDAELRVLARAADIWEGPLDNPDEAGEILEKILRRDHGSVAALTRLARIHERTGDREKAADVLERALALGPTGRDAADLFFRLGELAQGDDRDAAREHYQQALGHEAGHAASIAALEKLAREARDWPVVADMLERRLAATSAGGEGDATALAIELAGAYQTIGRPAAALPALERAAAAAPGDARVLAPLADLYVAAGMLDRAAPIVDRLAEDAKAGRRMKDVARYRQRQGAILEQRGDAAGAMAAYEEAFRIAPTDVPTMAGLGRLAMAAKDWEKARRVYRALVLQNLDENAGVTKAGVYLALGQIHVELNEGPKAKGMFQRGLELEPDNQALKDALARV